VRIAWVLYGGLEQLSGGTIYDAEVVAGLRHAGDDVRVVSLDAEAGGAVGVPRGVRATLPPIARAAATAKAGFALAREIRAIAPDVVVGDELCFRELAIAFRMLGRSDAGERPPKRVLLVHHLTAWEPELAALQRRVIRAGEQLAIDACDAIIATSRTTRERLLAENAKVPIAVVLPGADRLERGGGGGGGGGGGARFVFVGAVVARKRVLELVRAFAGGAHAEGRLTIVGSVGRDARYVREVRDEIARRGIEDRVVMTGEVDERGVARALEDADVMVMPSSLEGYGIAATEAVRAGIPVIAARAQGLEEALAPCPDATIFADDEASLASALSRFSRDAVLRASMRAAARAASSSMPTWSDCASAFRAALVA
jgi:glycosyltransferase involved in cell wall biosynthesis